MLRLILFTCVILILCFNNIEARKGYGAGAQDWGFINIRKGAHLFYWLHYTTATENVTERPLVIWLQGGPGQSSTAMGNFQEIGPLDIHGNERNYTWVKDVNVLFIDSPVGSGFSYVDNDDDVSYLATNYQRVANDLIIFIKAFYKKYIDFENVPLHIFGESYGAKVAVRFALNLHHAIERQKIKCNLKSVTLVSAAVAMKESAMVYAPYLLYMGMIDTLGYNKIMNITKDIKMQIKARNWKESYELWHEAIIAALTESGWYDVNNVLAPIPIPQDEYLDELTQLMRGAVSKNLSIPTNIIWGSQFDMTYHNARVDIMKPAVHVVSELLDSTQLQVSVISGQLDCVTPLAGTQNWLNKMKWSYKNEYMTASRDIIYMDNIAEAYEKTVRKLSVYSIRRAGHMIAADNPKAMKYILQKITNYG